MPRWDGFSAWVMVDEQYVTEYSVETSYLDKTVSCWIPSELGKTFSIHWQNTSYKGDTVGHIKLDGNPSGGVMIRGDDVPKGVMKTGISDGMTLKRFSFSSLNLTDDDAFLAGPPVPEALGLIQLVIYPVEITERGVPSTSSVVLPGITVHEKFKKGVEHHMAKLSEWEEISTPRTLVSSRRTGPDLVSFFFKYRPMAILQASGIAPLSLPLKRKASAGISGIPDENRSKRVNVVKKVTKQIRNLTQEMPPEVKPKAPGNTPLSQNPTPLAKRVKLNAVPLSTSRGIIDLSSPEIIDLTVPRVVSGIIDLTTPSPPPQVIDLA